MSTSKTESEHEPGFACVVIWGNGAQVESQVVRELNRKYDVRLLERANFAEKGIEIFLSSFYPCANPRNIKYKAREIQNGMCTVSLLSQKPDSELSFQESLNDFKRDIRNEFGNVLHVSDNENEALENIWHFKEIGQSHIDKLLSEERSVFLFPHKAKHSSESLRFPKKKFDSMHEVFARLDQCVDYVLLRNFNGLWNAAERENHSDVDILTSDRFVAETCLLAEPVFSDSRRVRSYVDIAADSLPFDIRVIGDGYYDPVWQEKMIAEAKIVRGVRVCGEEDEKWGLLYHCLVHKGYISEDYIEVLGGLGVLDIIDKPKKLWRLLMSHTRKHGYRITLPNDFSVRAVRTGNAHLNKFFLLIKLFGHKVAKTLHSIDVDFLRTLGFAKMRNRAVAIKSNVFRSGDLFIKYSPGPAFDFLLENEFRHLQGLVEEPFTPTPLYIGRQRGDLVLVTNRLRGKPVSKLVRLNQRKLSEIRLLGYALLKRLEDLGVEHADVSARNLIYSKGQLALVDFEFAKSLNYKPTPNKTHQIKLYESLTVRLRASHRDQPRTSNADIDAFEKILEELGSSKLTKRLRQTFLESLLGNWSFDLRQELIFKAKSVRFHLATALNEVKK